MRATGYLNTNRRHAIHQPTSQTLISYRERQMRASLNSPVSKINVAHPKVLQAPALIAIVKALKKVATSHRAHSHPSPPHAPRIRRASCISLCIMVTRLA